MSSHALSCVSAFGSRLRNPVTHRHAHHVRQRSRRSQARPISAAAAISTGPHTAAELPPSLRNTTAVLHTAEGAAAYVLGISHVSKESCQHIEELIRLVQPDIVLVELCKDRTGLLVDPDAPSPPTWYTPRFSLTGLPTAPGWPTAVQLMGLLKGTGCTPVSAADIEDNAVALLSTGLFRSVRVAAKPPAAASAPAFAVQPSGALQAVAPLDAIEYMLAPRQLPPVQQLSVKAEGGAAAPAADIQARAQSAAATGGGVAAYLAARAVLLEGQPENVDVSFEGVEAGKPVALLHILPAGQQRALTGLEPTAAGGAGAGIESFQRQAPRRATPSSSSSSGSSGIQLGAASKQAAAQGGGSIGQLSSAQFTELVPWSREQLARGAASSGAASGGGNALSSFLTSTYAKYQGAAGRSVGIAPGEAWRVALRAAVAAGASQYHLGDAPADTTAQRLASAILSASLPRILGSLVASVASGIVLYQGLLDSGAPANPAAVAAAAALPVVVALAPVVAPLVEVARFAGLSAREIEDTVRLKEPLQVLVGPVQGHAASADAPIVKLWGEDALLNWPGALEPIITQRDAYMARSIAAAASGRPEGLTPAYVLTHSGSGATLQYAMPVGGEAGACPLGAGAGQYQPLPGPKTVVAVVGTAHVRGMIRQWPAAQQDPSLKPLL